MQSAEISIRIVRRSRYQNDWHWNYAVNLYPFNTFYFVLSGDGHVKIGNTITDLLPGYVYLIPANTVYSCFCSKSIHKLYVEAHVEYLPGFDVFSNFHSIESMYIGTAKIEEMLLRNTDNPRDALWFKGVFEQTAAEFICDEIKAPSQRSMYFEPLLHIIQSELSPRLSLDTLSKSMGMSASSLRKKFREAYELSIKQYCINLLMSHLREELITTDKTLKMICDEYHFCDPYYLSAFFKKHEGESPAAYRIRNVHISPFAFNGCSKVD